MKFISLFGLLCLMLLVDSEARMTRTTRGGVFGSARNWFRSVFKPKSSKPVSSYGRSAPVGRTSSFGRTPTYGTATSHGKPQSWNSYSPPAPRYTAPIKPSSGRSTTKSILAGLAAGYVGYKLTKGASRLMHNGIRYYPANNYYSEYNPSYSQSPTYSGRYGSGTPYGGSTPMIRVRCEYDLPEDEMNMVNITMANGARATKLIYECDFNTQICCGMECCPKSTAA